MATRKKCAASTKNGGTASVFYRILTERKKCRSS